MPEDQFPFGGAAEPEHQPGCEPETVEVAGGTSGRGITVAEYGERVRVCQCAADPGAERVVEFLAEKRLL